MLQNSWNIENEGRVVEDEVKEVSRNQTQALYPWLWEPEASPGPESSPHIHHVSK